MPRASHSRQRADHGEQAGSTVNNNNGSNGMIIITAPARMHPVMMMMRK